MKILNTDQVRLLDQYTIEQEPIASIDLMERASITFVEWFTAIFDAELSILICCGPGNNGGDGLAVARLLHEKGYIVSVVLLEDGQNTSKDFKVNLGRLPIPYQHFRGQLQSSDIIIDAIFGSGLSRTAEGKFAEAIEAINGADALRVAIDVPSGLFTDQHTPGDKIVRADFTACFQLPKLAFMFPETYQYVGGWEVLDIGLSEQFIDESNTDYFFTIQGDVEQIIKQTQKFDHKGNNGHALLMAGSYGKMGAAVLAASAAIRSGVGLLTMHIPKHGNDLLQMVVPEAMTKPDNNELIISHCPDIEKYHSVGIGPGIGKDKATVQAFHELLSKASRPLVIDADAINILAESREFLQLLPENSILTPHPKEFQRLVNVRFKNDFKRLEQLKNLSIALKCIIVLKGAHSAIALPDGSIYFNSTGNPGMAKAGSGDVLTGVITSLLAQQYEPNEAAILGVYLHGLAGDISAQQFGEISMSAGDIVDSLSKANQFINE